MSRSTVADVARLAGVSTATVSRVLTGSVPVSEQLRRRVEEAAAQLDYRVNPLARALRRDRSAAVGMVVPDLANPFFTLLVDGVERGVQGLGMTLHLCSSHNDPETEASRIRSLLAAQVEVLVVTPVHVRDSGEALRHAADQVPLIQLDQFADGVESNWAGVDDEFGMRLVIEHLAAQGVRRAAYVGAAATDSSARARPRIARRAAAEHGIELPEDPRLLGAFSSEWGRRAAEILASGPLPDAVCCGADVVALGVLEGFDALGVRVPEDVLVTGFDDIPLSHHPRISITTVRQPIEQITGTVAAMLSGIVTETERTTERVAIAPELVARRTTSRRIPA